MTSDRPPKFNHNIWQDAININLFFHPSHPRNIVGFSTKPVHPSYLSVSTFKLSKKKKWPWEIRLREEESRPKIRGNNIKIQTLASKNTRKILKKIFLWGIWICSKINSLLAGPRTDSVDLTFGQGNRTEAGSHSNTSDNNKRCRK